jgi:hypothetical protein
MSAPPAPPTSRRASTRLPWLFLASAPFLCFLVLGGCGGDRFSSSEPLAGAGGDGGKGGTAGTSGGGRAGATGGSGPGESGRGGSSDAGAGGDGASGDGVGGDGTSGDNAGGDGSGGDGAGNCNLTCCNGNERAHTTFDEALCVSAARGDRFCDEHGGPQLIEFERNVVWENGECTHGDYNCLATCCDGSRSYVTQEAENECAFYGMYACEHDGGPINITFDGRTVFTADVECPTARTCILECCDGFEYDRSPAFSTDNCVFFNANSSVCADEGHGANKQLVFGAAVVWSGTCP